MVKGVTRIGFGPFANERISLGCPKEICEEDWSAYIGLTELRLTWIDNI
jgi:hypothetical protein